MLNRLRNGRAPNLLRFKTTFLGRGYGVYIKKFRHPQVFNWGSVGFVSFKITRFPIEDFGNDEFF